MVTKHVWHLFSVHMCMCVCTFFTKVVFFLCDFFALSIRKYDHVIGSVILQYHVIGFKIIFRLCFSTL